MPNTTRTHSTSESDEKEWPLKWVALGLVFLFAVLCWCLAAASYSHNELGWRTGGVEASAGGEFETGRRGRRALIDFLINAVEQLPNAPRVISYTFARAWWVLILLAVLETFAIVFWIKARALENELSPKRRK